MLSAFALGAALLAWVVQQRLEGGEDGPSYEHTVGPLRATISTDGAVQLGATVTVLHRGEAFGWASTICARLQTGLLLQARLVRLTDNTVMRYQERALPTDARGCSNTVWNILLPPDTPPGRYQVQRYLLLTPPVGPPHTHPLPPLSVEVSS